MTTEEELSDQKNPANQIKTLFVEISSREGMVTRRRVLIGHFLPKLFEAIWNDNFIQVMEVLGNIYRIAEEM